LNLAKLQENCSRHENPPLDCINHAEQPKFFSLGV
jgi:hypothetical protein